MVWDLEGKRKEALKTFTDDDLASELERRRKKAEGPPPMIRMRVEIEGDPMAELIANQSHTVLENACRRYVDEILSDNPEPEDQYVFEAVMELFYGKDFWKWHNSRYLR